MNIFAPVGILVLLISESIGSVAVIAACCLIHEAGHLLMMKALGVKLLRTDIEPFGMTLCFDPLTPYRSEILVAVAGSGLGLASSLAALACHAFFSAFGLFYFACCGIILSVVNLVPLGSLDGGTALRAWTKARYGEEKGEKISLCVSRCVCVLFLAAATVLFASGLLNASLAAMCVCSLMIVPDSVKRKGKKE